MDDATRTELEAAAFRRLVGHLRERSDVQNIDLMNLSGFCRNCLSKWYRAAAEEKGLEMSYDDARTIVYGMSYSDWKTNEKLYMCYYYHAGWTSHGIHTVGFNAKGGVVNSMWSNPLESERRQLSKGELEFYILDRDWQLKAGHCRPPWKTKRH